MKMYNINDSMKNKYTNTNISWYVEKQIIVSGLKIEYLFYLNFFIVIYYTNKYSVNIFT